MKKSCLIFFLLILFLTYSYLNTTSTFARQEFGRVSTVIIMDPDDFEKTKGDLSISRFIDYELYVWVELDNQETRLSSILGNSTYSAINNPHVISVGNHLFDPLVDDPFSEKLNSSSYQDDDPGLYLIQFIGPIKDEWLSAIDEIGIERIQYYARNSYLVWLTRKLLHEISEQKYVRWIGVYDDSYKAAKDLLSSKGDDVPIQALFYTNELIDIPDVIEMNNGVIYSVVYDGTNLATINFSVNDTEIENIIKIPSLIVAQLVKESQVSDEISSLIVAGEYTGTTPNPPGYLNWLPTGIDGSDVIVQIVDLGIDQTHEDLVGRQVAELNGDRSGSHGTHVAGILLGNGDGGNGETDEYDYLYGLGVASGAQYVDYKMGCPSLWPFCDRIENYLAAVNDYNFTISQNSWGFTDLIGVGYTLMSEKYDRGVRMLHNHKMGYNNFM